MRTKLAIIGAAVCLARAAFAVTMASQPWTMNRIAEAEARIASNIVEAIDGIPAPDFSQNNAQLRETIVAVSPPADLTEATNHTRAALSAFAGTGTVERARSYGTPTRWTDASGGVWELADGMGPWSVTVAPETEGILISNIRWGYDEVLGVWRLLFDVSTPNGYGGRDYLVFGTETSTEIVYVGDLGELNAGIGWTLNFSRHIVPNSATNYVGRVALTNDIPATLPENDPTVPSWAKAETKPSYSWNEITGKPQVVDEEGAAAIAETVVREKSLGGIWDAQLDVWWTPVMVNGALTYEANAVQNAADTLAVVSNIVASGGLASVDAVDAKISTNNAAFVSAVLAVPLTDANAGDLAEIAEYGGYGTVGAAILALIAGLAALKRRVTSAETALAQKAGLTDLPYRLVTPGEWEFSGSGYDPSKEYFVYESVYESSSSSTYVYNLMVDGGWADDNSELPQGALTVNFDSAQITATRPSLPGHLLDRAGNRVVVTGATTLTLPAAVPGYLRDFLVRLEISGSTVPTITFAASGNESLTYETDGDEFPVPDEAGTWLYSFTEDCVAHTFAVSLKKVNEVAAPQAQGGS